MDGGADARRQLAAAVIQRCWRSCQLRRLYRFYRDLIREREKGDAATLLRMVNPKASRLRWLLCTPEVPSPESLPLLMNAAERPATSIALICRDRSGPSDSQAAWKCGMLSGSV